jgi:hypothetical protein
MAIDATKLKKPAGLGAPPTPAEAPGNVKPNASLQDLARQRRALLASEVEDPAPVLKESKPGRKGRPKLDYETRQLGARVHVDTYARIEAITKRERVGLGPLVDRMVVLYEEARLKQAQALGEQAQGETNDDFIARVFRL